MPIKISPCRFGVRAPRWQVFYIKVENKSASSADPAGHQVQGGIIASADADLVVFNNNVEIQLADRMGKVVD